ncbi:CoA isomerase (plasmid) [Mycobacterium branderi]|uniref:CoA isomerase n=1 Tax=Mycobacterium branderi TaxID=43348 RepID=A0ABM7KW88_9MYCO|nr:CoA isomerase [Mycobacterium branderi]
MLNRPERLNAMNGPLMDSLAERLGWAARNPDVRCVVLCGSGSSFCAGGDVALMTDAARGASAQDNIGPRIDEQVDALDRRFASIEHLVSMPKPTVAMIRGWALGGGLCLALACDLRFAADDAKLGAGFLKQAISGNFGLAFLLASVLGSARAREFVLLHEWVSATDALLMGLVSAVRPSAELQSYTESVCSRLASGPTFAYGKFKDSLNFAMGTDLRRVLHYEAVNSRMTSLSDDAREAAAAFREKREPRFAGAPETGNTDKGVQR